MAMDLLKRNLTQVDYERALESWSWLDRLDGLTPMFASLLGDVVLAGPTGGRWFLDTLEGTLIRKWASHADMAAELQTTAGLDQFLLAGLAEAASRAGLVLGDSQVYAFTVPPALGGQFDVSNIKVMDFVVAVNLAGQLHGQIRDLPPGTPISGFSLADPTID